MVEPGLYSLFSSKDNRKNAKKLGLGRFSGGKDQRDYRVLPAKGMGVGESKDKPLED